MRTRDEKLARQLEKAACDLLNRQTENLFREALLEANPALNISGISVVCDVRHTEQLTILGVDDETLDRAVSIFQRKQL